MSLPAPEITPEPHSEALRPDGKRGVIIPLDVRGRFIRARRLVFLFLVALYCAIPLVHIGGHPAIHLDVPSRSFYIVGKSFNAQDIWLLAPLVLSLVFGLFFITAWRGRVWCGWACPQTVFLEGLFRPIERFFQGSRSRRLAERGKPWTLTRALRAAGKNVVHGLLSLGLGHAALIPFVPLGTMPAMFRDGPGAHPVAFAWAMALSASAFFVFSWFREQICVVVCPYGRLQAALHDTHSVIIGYDAIRGEPRTRLRSPKLTPLPESPASQRGGDCIDCRKCVWACPTGIDIRNGFQMECVACAQCIDVCDDVMAKVGRPKGLIRFASMRAFEGKATRTLRPRLVLYASLFFVATTAFILALWLRTPFEANIVRSPGVPWVLDGDTVRNQTDLHLVNKSPQTRTFLLSLTKAPNIEARFGETRVTLPSLEHANISLVLLAARKEVRGGRPVELVVRDADTGAERRVPFRFAAP